MLHPKKHAPDFVCKKRYTTEFELQKGTRCTPFYIKKMRPITGTTWLSTCMNFAWHLVCLCKIQASYVEAHSLWFFDFSRIQRFDGQWVLFREFSHEYFYSDTSSFPNPWLCAYWSRNFSRELGDFIFNWWEGLRPNILCFNPLYFQIGGWSGPSLTWK